MARVGELQRLFSTFLRLQKTCKKAEVTFYSDGRGDCHVTLRVQTPGNVYQTPRRGSGLPRSREKEVSGAQNPASSPGRGPRVWPPSPAPKGVSVSQKLPPAPPQMRSRKRGPAALFRDERRRLARIELDETEVEGESALPLALSPPSSLAAPLVLRATSPPAPREEVVEPGPAAAAGRACKKCKQPIKGHSGPAGLVKCSAPLSSPPLEHLRDSSPSLPPSLHSPDREVREEPHSPEQSSPPPSPSEYPNTIPSQESPPGPSSLPQKRSLPPSSPDPPLPDPSSQQQWPFPDSEEEIQCMLCYSDGDEGNMFVGNYAIASHIVIDHNQFCTCVHCERSLPDEDGIFSAHMEQCLPCPGYPRCPFKTGQCPSLGDDFEPSSDYCAAPLD